MALMGIWEGCPDGWANIWGMDECIRGWDGKTRSVDRLVKWRDRWHRQRIDDWNG